MKEFILKGSITANVGEDKWAVTGDGSKSVSVSRNGVLFANAHSIMAAISMIKPKKISNILVGEILYFDQNDSRKILGTANYHRITYGKEFEHGFTYIDQERKFYIKRTV